MSKEFYVQKDFKQESLDLIHLIDDIIEEYVRQGYRMTVRQIYYQLVRRALIENTERSYKRIVGLINDAKLAGLLDWDAIEDRTRDFIRRTHWESGNEILHHISKSYNEDMWTMQPIRIFVVVEKEALVGVLENICWRYDIPLLAARGYPSGTVLREFAERDITPCFNWGQTPVILHLGDHDPSGIDMSRDLEERLKLFTGQDEDGDLIDFQRIALNMDQIQEQRPPENPAKTTDSRFLEYRRKYGSSSWELDALTPDYLNNLVESHVTAYIDDAAWEIRREEIDAVKAKLQKLSEKFKP